VKFGLNSWGNKFPSIHKGSNGQYYSAGRCGAMNTQTAENLIFLREIFTSRFGDIAPDFAEKIVDLLWSKYEKTQKK
jgi:hypothetical protein